METNDATEITFEDAFRQLEQTVALLEGGGLTIDALVDRFEEGMKLVGVCRQRLDSAQARLSRLVRDDDSQDNIAILEAESLDA